MRSMEITPMAEDQLEDTLHVWHRSMLDSNAWLAPEQGHPPEEEYAFFRKVIAVECKIWVATEGEVILGMMAMSGNEIDRLYIDVGEQRRGIGTALMQHAKTLCPAGLHLVTLQGNAAACQFYERHGFVASERGVSPAPESEPDVRYRWAGSQS